MQMPAVEVVELTSESTKQAPRQRLAGSFGAAFVASSFFRHASALSFSPVAS
jgi:hypothetical protein